MSLKSHHWFLLYFTILAPFALYGQNPLNTTDEAILLTANEQAYYWGAFFGILAILFFYHLFLFFSIKDISLLYYSLVIFFGIHFYMVGIPAFGAYLYKLIPWVGFNAKWMYNQSMCYICLLLIFYLLFARNFLNIKKNSKTMDCYINILISYLIFTVLISIHDFHLPLFFFSAKPILIVILSVFVISIIALVKRYKQSVFFVFANNTLAIGAILAILNMLGVTGMTFKLYIFNPDQVGLILFFALLSFALGDTINKLKIETIRAQEKALAVLEEKVVERTAEVVQQKEETERQKQLVEEKNKEIVDSITYAKRLQDAILPPVSLINKYFPESFVLYKPKDIVAGDFYWMEKITHPSIPSLSDREGESHEHDKGVSRENILIAACDCTGHGVPGAMVSVVCSNALNRAVKEFHITEPGKILDKVRELVVETFEKSENNVQDGMDISLLAISHQPLAISWAGAYNSLWYIQNGEMKEIPADKQPIGKSDNPKPFTTHCLPLNPHSVSEGTLYLFTDGYADQFGGPKGKKFKYKALQETLIAISHQPMAEQQKILKETLENWKGGLEQVDDILVIGIRI